MVSRFKESYFGDVIKDAIYCRCKATVRPTMISALGTRAETYKARYMLETNEIKVLRKIICKTKIE
jgi:hypothetical protein